MTDTNRRTADEILRALTELLIEYQQQGEEAVVGDAAPHSPQCTSNGDDAGAPAPWANLAGLEETNLLYKMPPDVVAKMDWVMDNVPRMTKQRIVREAVGAYLDGLIEKHYKPN